MIINKLSSIPIKKILLSIVAKIGDLERTTSYPPSEIGDIYTGKVNLMTDMLSKVGDQLRLSVGL